MQRGSFFVKEHVLANMSFMSYVQVNVFARKGRNWIQTIVHIILLKKACFYNTCSNSRPCASLFVWYRRSNDQPTRPSNRSSSSNPPLLLPERKKSRGVKSGATTEWGLTAQIIISSAYINRWSVGSNFALGIQVCPFFVLCFVCLVEMEPTSISLITDVLVQTSPSPTSSPPLVLTDCGFNHSIKNNKYPKSLRKNTLFLIYKTRLLFSWYSRS